MPYAHDYYGPHHGPHDPNDLPHLHNRGEGRPYLEYDYHANDHGRQLPSISTIGRGPRGEGLTVGNVVNEDGTVSFALYSDLTGELVWQSPNLDPGTLDFYPTDFRDLTAGQPAPMDIVHTRGGVTKTTTAYLPCGERGSLVFLLGGRSVPRVPSDTYQTTAEELMIYGHRVWPNDNKPLPHVNDIVFFRYTDGDETGFAFGTIETVGTRNNENTVPSTPIVYTARVFVPCTGGGTAEPLIVEASWRTRGKSVNDEYELVCGETAGVMYEAFVAGRKVLLHATNTPSQTREIATREDYYEIIDATTNNVDTNGTVVITDYLFFTASLPGLNDLDNLEQSYVLVRSDDCLENDYPIFYPRKKSYTPLIVTLRPHSVKALLPKDITASNNEKKADTKGGTTFRVTGYEFNGFKADTTAGDIYEAYLAGKSVVFDLINQHIKGSNTKAIADSADRPGYPGIFNDPDNILLPMMNIASYSYGSTPIWPDFPADDPSMLPTDDYDWNIGDAAQGSRISLMLPNTILIDPTITGYDEYTYPDPQNYYPSNVPIIGGRINIAEIQCQMQYNPEGTPIPAPCPEDDYPYFIVFAHEIVEEVDDGEPGINV